jgi:hypothetical protein
MLIINLCKKKSFLFQPPKVSLIMAVKLKDKLKFHADDILPFIQQQQQS